MKARKVQNEATVASKRRVYIMIEPVYKVFASVCGMTRIPCVNKEAEVCSLEVH